MRGISPMGAFQNKSILVIDDDVGMLHALTKVLVGEGCTVASAASSTVAMEYLLEGNRNLDLIITDIRMPLLDGMEVLEIVKANRPTVPVIVITAYGGPEAEAEAHESGAAGYLEKPVDSPKLLEAIRRALSNSQEATSS
ncbi:MAG TPA: response regulator [Verrucomicrobiae bacterium]|nr:response regulator [Verrucomicrobiae bacterium]